MPETCSCGAVKQSYGTQTLLCPACDFARCKNKACNKAVQQLSWTICPHCRTRQ